MPTSIEEVIGFAAEPRVLELASGELGSGQLSSEVSAKASASTAVLADCRFLHWEDLASAASDSEASDLAGSRPASAAGLDDLPRGDSALGGNLDDCSDPTAAFRSLGDSRASVACSWVDENASCRRIPGGATR